MLATLALDPTLCALHFRSETRATRTGAETHFEQAALVIVAWLSVPARSLTAMQKKGGKIPDLLSTVLCWVLSAPNFVQSAP
jgi:hypothetical protein